MNGPTWSTLDVPGARLQYASRGQGPLLLLIGSPMDSSGFAPLAEIVAARRRVVTYDPRGIGRSTRDDTTTDVTPEQQADDVHRVIDTLGGGPVDVFGSSGGAVVGLALVTAHPDEVRTLVAHEPPVVRLAPDGEHLLAGFREIVADFPAEGVARAMQRFMALAGLPRSGADGADADAPRPAPSADELARWAATMEHFLVHLVVPTVDYEPDVERLRTGPCRVVVARGASSGTQLARRTADALAGRLGVDAVDFPGDHTGFVTRPAEFAAVLEQVLDQVLDQVLEQVVEQVTEQVTAEGTSSVRAAGPSPSAPGRS